MCATCVTGTDLDKEILVVDTSLDSWTGAQIVCGVFKLLEEWNIKDKIIGFSYDATNSNTGVDDGACAQLELL